MRLNKARAFLSFSIVWDFVMVWCSFIDFGSITILVAAFNWLWGLGFNYRHGNIFQGLNFLIKSNKSYTSLSPKILSADLDMRHLYHFWIRNLVRPKPPERTAALIHNKSSKKLLSFDILNITFCDNTVDNPTRKK